MSALFSPEWTAAFGKAWNAEPGLGDALAKIDFNSNAAYGFTGEVAPRGVLEAKNGMVEKAGAYEGQPLNCDIRYPEDCWRKWLQTPPDVMKIGVACTTGKQTFVQGEYAAMIKDPHMAGPFIKSFAAMSKVG